MGCMPSFIGDLHERRVSRLRAVHALHRASLVRCERLGDMFLLKARWRVTCMHGS